MMKRHLLATLLLVACGDSSADTETSTGEATSSTTPAAEPCTPGESIACACTDGGEGAQVCAGDGLSFTECVCEPGGSTSGETETGVDTESTTDDTTGEPVEPAPRWVLRDKDGVEVDAVVEPSCGEGQSNDCVQGPGAAYPCVRVLEFGGEYRNVTYGLTDGRYTSCATGGATLYYPDDTCTSASWVGAYADEQPRWFAIEGVVYETDPDSYAEAEHWVLSNGECYKEPFPGHVSFAEVPSSFHTLPGAPLSVTFE